jgi:hypothetical protein
MGWLQENSGAAYPAVAFDQIGATIVGRVIEKPRVVKGEKLDGSGEEESLVIAVEVLPNTAIMAGKKDDRVPASVGEIVSIWVKPFGNLTAMLVQALSAYRHDEPAVGAILAIRYTHDGEQTKRGMNPPKQYFVEYRAPQPIAQGQSLIGGAAQQQINQGEPFPAQQPAPLSSMLPNGQSQQPSTTSLLP